MMVKGSKVKFSDARIDYHKENPSMIGTITEIIKGSYGYDPPAVDLVWVRWSNGTHLVHRRISLTEI